MFTVYVGTRAIVQTSIASVAVDHAVEAERENPGATVAIYDHRDGCSFPVTDAMRDQAYFAWATAAGQEPY